MIGSPNSSVDTSFPSKRGAFTMHQSWKCDCYWVRFMPPFPTSSMSGSFQPELGPTLI